jgi:endonuclease YncB( thermonuclease family)
MGDLVEFKAKKPRTEKSGRPAKLDSVLVVALILAAMVAGAFLGRNVDLRPMVAGLATRLPGSSVAPQGIDARAYDSNFHTASFYFCHSGGGTNCVVDGDTFWFRGENYRIADIDAPETHPSRCAAESDKGGRATDRLRSLLNDGAFQLEPVDRDVDRYGRKLRIVTRNGESLGRILVDEGLARTWTGGRQPWC